MKIFTVMFTLLTLIGSTQAFGNERKSIKIGSSPLPNKMRFHCPHRRHCRDEYKNREGQAWVDITYPSNDTLRRHAYQCAIIAAGVTGAAAVFASPAAAKLVFEPAFKTCLAKRVGDDLANRVSINLRTKTWESSWSGH